METIIKPNIKSAIIENFKGVKYAEYTFGEITNIFGANGAGKTTISTAWYWLMGNKDTELNDNPPIFPNDAEEVTPKVTFVLDIDGTEVTVAKIQKRTVKKSKDESKPDTISLSNSYEVNSVEYGERDFKKKLESYGFDMEKFMQLSHPDVFTNQMHAKKDLDNMRNTLFEMSSTYTDLEVAEQIEGIAETRELLKSYTTEEIEAMQKATLRKIGEVYGNKGEILRAKIEGMENSKEDIDVAELELQQNALNEQIAANEEKQANVDKQLEGFNKLSDGALELKLELGGLQQKANLDLEKKRREIRTQIDDVERQLKEVAYQIRMNKQDIQSAVDSIKSNESRIQAEYGKWTDYDNELKAVEKYVFDENSLICSMCGQEYPTEKKEQLQADFDAKKKDKTEQLESDKTATEKRGKELRAAIDKDKAEIQQLKATLKENEDEEISLLESIAELNACLEELSQSIDISDREDVLEIQRQIAEKEEAMQNCNSASEIRQQLKDEHDALQKELIEVEKKFALVKKNIDIDEEIAKLRKKQGEYEQNRANAEKILDQLKEVIKKKAEMVTDEINSNFDIVKWKLHEFLKNGEYKSCCIPLIDGKQFGESTNTGREVLAKLDIIKGLQRFYGQYYPIFLDNSECLSEETRKRINMDCQMIYLTVSEDRKLKVEVSG